MKRILTIILCVLMLGLTFFYIDDISNYLANYLDSTHKITNIEKNKYSKNTNYDYVQITNDFVPYNYQELLNVFYTILDYGYTSFTFYCPSEYSDCINDVQNISDSNNVEILTALGNFVSPYNNFSSIKVKYDTAGEVTVDVNKLYTDEDIQNINNKIDSVWKEIVTSEMSDEDIIYAFHDYIINHAKYDETFNTNDKTNNYESNKANGPLFEGYAICSGYTDTMALVLDRLGIKNYKVATKTHVWNALYINNEWLNIDLTWDDPVSSDGQDHLEHKFYLIDTNTLEGFQIENHNFDKSIYQELINN